MKRSDYLKAAIDLYLAAPGTPERASRADWAIAADIFRTGVPLPRLAHAVRLATVRRLLSTATNGSTAGINSFAYFRAVLHRMTADERQRGYVDYIRDCYQQLIEAPGEDPSRETAVPSPESRAL